eukprot:SAG11_NODE_39966_length_215_cov_209.405172_1_plen_48_part_10
MMNTPQRLVGQPEQELTPTRESVSFEVGDTIVISPKATHLDKERKKLR